MPRCACSLTALRSPAPMTTAAALQESNEALKKQLEKVSDSGGGGVVDSAKVAHLEEKVQSLTEETAELYKQQVTPLLARRCTMA